MDKEVKNLIPPILGLGNDWTIFQHMMQARFESPLPEEYNLPVSIIIPVYNRKEKLAKTIAALTHQTYPHELIEIIIADDGSSDNPNELCEIFGDQFSIKYIFQEDDGYRLSEIRNKGIEASTHDQVIILDCDMLPLPTLVESYMKYAHVSKKIVLIGGRRYVNTDEVNHEQILDDISHVTTLPSLDTGTGKIPEGNLPPSEDWRYKIYRSTNDLKNSKYPFRAFCGGNVCFHKSLIQTVGGFDEDFTAWGAEDTEFGFRVYNHGFWFIPVEGAEALHQEPPGGSNETDREGGKAITQPILIEKCPAFYRRMEKNRVYEVPKVSIYIPAYNAEEYIEEAIESGLNQTYTDLEIVVVNDGSTDATGEILDTMYSSEPRVRIIHQENGGISSATNTAINACKGEYIMQLDSDDAVLPECIESLVSVLERNDVGFVYGDSYLVDSHGELIGNAYSWSMYDRYKLLNGMMIHHPRMFRKRDFYRTPQFDTSLSNAVDYDFFLKLSEITDGYHLQTPLYLYRQHDTNTSLVDSEAQDKNNHKCILNAYERLGIKHLVTIEPEENHRRRMRVNRLENPTKFKLDLSHILQQFEINPREGAEFFGWEVSEMISPESRHRQNQRKISPNRFVRIGSYGSVKVASSVLARVEKEYSLEGSVFSIPVKSGRSYFVDIEAPNNDKKSIELMRLFLHEHNWKTEVVPVMGERDIVAMNQNTSKSFENYLEHRHSRNMSEEAGVNSNQYNVSKFWKMEDEKLIFIWNEFEIFFDLPKDWTIENTHEDLFRLAHYVMVSPWDASVLEGWQPSRKPGWRPGLAFSGGIDSAAALALMPSSTVLVYNERSGIEGILDHTNAIRFFDYLKSENREVIRVRSNHESIRTRDGKMPGFSTDYACAVQVILLADYFGFDSIGTGMPLENSYLWHGYKYRNFSESWFWNHYGEMFNRVGLHLYQPVAGCSEIVNLEIVKKVGYEGWAQSCLRSKKGGEVCSKCWKCFRKNSLLGTPFEYTGEIETFLQKRPLKQAASTLYAIQKNGVSKNGVNVVEKIEDIGHLLEINFEWMERYYLPSLELLPPRYKDFTKKKLDSFCSQMSKDDIRKLQSLNMFP
jgi:chondroitin synthase